MPYTAGAFALYTPGNPVVTGTTIQSSWANNTLNDVATALSTCVLKDGTQTITANIPFASFRLTGIGAATATTDAIQAAQVQNNSITALTTVSGSNTIVGTAAIVPSAYATGQVFSWIQATSNSGSATLNVSALGAVTLKKNTPAGLINLIAEDLIAANTYHARYDSTGPSFVLFNPTTSSPSNVDTALTATGTTQGTALELVSEYNELGTVAASTGVKLNSATGAGTFQIVYNGGANTVNVYPDSGSNINGLAANAAHILATKTTCAYYRTTATHWIGLLSA